MNARDTFLGRLSSSSAKRERLLFWLLIGAALAMGLVVLTAFVPAFVGGSAREDFGSFGDFVGGVLNPILTFIMFIVLIFTIILQQKELSLAREEFQRTASAMERENFEATVFRLASQIREGVNSTDLVHEGVTHSGTDAFKAFYERLEEIYEEADHPARGDHIKSYDAVYEEYGHDFGHYYRLLYFTFRHIKKSKEVWDSRSDGTRDTLDVDFYTKLIRAQISDYERLVFFYNFLSGRSDNFTDLIDEFAIFDNIDEGRLLVADHIDLVSKRARGC